MKKGRKLLWVGSVLLFLCVSMLVTVFHEKEYYSYYENRNLAPCPQLTLSGIRSGTYMKDMSTYLQDHSAWRTQALVADTWLNIHVLKRPVINQVVYGADILLPHLPYEQVEEATVAAQARDMAEHIGAIRTITEQNGGSYYYVSVPCQYAYFADQYPAYLNNRQDMTRWSRQYLKQALAEQKVHYLDMGDVFEACGHPADMSSSIDNHYSLKGAWATYEALAELIGETADVSIQLPADIQFHTLKNPYMGSRTRKLFGLHSCDEKLLWASFGQEIPFTRTDNGVPVPDSVYQMPEHDTDPVPYTFYMGGDIGETVVSTRRPQLPRVLIYGDSFTNALESLLYYSCDEMRSLDFRHYREKDLKTYIEEYQPDVVICVRDYESMLGFGGNGVQIADGGDCAPDQQ